MRYQIYAAIRLLMSLGPNTLRIPQCASIDADTCDFVHIPYSLNFGLFVVLVL